MREYLLHECVKSSLISVKCGQCCISHNSLKSATTKGVLLKSTGVCMGVCNRPSDTTVTEAKIRALNRCSDGPYFILS